MKLTTKPNILTIIKSNQQLRHIIRAVLYAVLGFVLSSGTILEDLHPLGISAVAVAKRRYFVYCAVGAALGTLVHGVNAMAARYLCAVAIATLGALAAAAFHLNDRPAFSFAVATLACLATGILLNYKTEAAAAAYLLTAGESIICGGASFFFYRASHANYRQLRLGALPQGDFACVILTASLLLADTARWQLWLVTPALTLAAAAVLTALYYYDAKTGGLLAIGFGFALAIGIPERLFIVGAMAFAALTASLLATYGMLAAGTAFLSVAAFFAIADASEAALPFFVSTMAGTLIFWLLPSSLTNHLEEMADRRKEERNDSALRQSLVLKLRFAGSAMAAVSESVEQVREKINVIAHRENSLMKEQIGEQEYLNREIVLEKTNQIRRVASDQFFSIADMLEDLAFEFDEAEIFDAAASSRIRRLLCEYDIYPQSISAIEDQYGRMRVEILTDSRAEGLDNPLLPKEIGKICSRYFDSGKITRFQNDSMLSFSERPGYRLEVAFAQHSAEGNLCGDTVKIVNDSKGHTILIISDGMGTGSRAALDGAMGAGLLSKLLNAGFGFDSALKIINCALLVKSNDESLATLDIANIDLFTGKCDFLKAGAPAGYIIKGEELVKCELSSMPAGILRGIEFARRTAVLRPEDTVVLMSDGVSDMGEAPLRECLLSLGERHPRDSAAFLLQEALQHIGEERQDDMSIIVAKLERN